MKEQILAKLDERIAAAEKELTPMNPRYYSADYRYWKGLLDAREIITKTEDEGVKHG